MNKDTFIKRMAETIATQVRVKGFCIQFYGSSLYEERDKIGRTLDTTCGIKTIRISDYADIYFISDENIHEQVKLILCENFDSKRHFQIMIDSFSNMLHAQLSDSPEKNPHDDDFIGNNVGVSNR